MISEEFDSLSEFKQLKVMLLEEDTDSLSEFRPICAGSDILFVFFWPCSFTARCFVLRCRMLTDLAVDH